MPVTEEIKVKKPIIPTTKKSIDSPKTRMESIKKAHVETPRFVDNKRSSLLQSTPTPAFATIPDNESEPSVKVFNVTNVV